MHNPPHPGQILKSALEDLPMSVTDFAAHIGIARNNLSRILNGKAGITAEMSIRISSAFGQTPDLWFKLQGAYDFWQASQAKHTRIKRLRLPLSSVSM